MADERRQYTRIAFHAPAQLIFSDKTLDVVVLDLSLKGALVRFPANTAIAEGVNALIHITLNGTGDQIGMEIRIAHVEGRYAGLQCLAIDLDSATHLRRLVELNLGKPELLERELALLSSEENDENPG